MAFRAEWYNYLLGPLGRSATNGLRNAVVLATRTS